MNNKVVAVNIRFIKKTKKTNIVFRAYFPLINGLIYKPYKISLLTGVMSDLHKDNKSKNKIKARKFKDELLNEITIKTGKNEFTISAIKEFSNNNSIGIISFLGMIMASNQNRHSQAVIMCEDDEYKGLSIAKLFQDPKAIDIKSRRKYDFNSFDVISFDTFLNDYRDYATKLYESYYDNIKTCTAETTKIAMNKNGQAKPVQYKLFVNHIKRLEDEGYNSTSAVMNAFKKNLDAISLKKGEIRKCVVCNIDHPNMMVASHIKARAESTDIKEKIDGRNGMWLCAQHDRAFDRRLFSFSPKTGKVEISNKLLKQKIINPEYKLPKTICDKSNSYLKFHNQKFLEKFK